MSEKKLLTELRGVGEKRAKIYSKLGIQTADELIHYYPRDYIDYSSPKKISEIEDGELCVFEAAIAQKLKPIITPKVKIYRCILADETGEMLCTLFNMDYTFRNLIEGEIYTFYGRVSCNLIKREVSSPSFIPIEQENRLVPKYPLKAGITQNIISMNVKSAFDACEIEELLPEAIRKKYDLMDKQDALWQIHFPTDKMTLEKAKKRLIFEELFVLQLGLSLLKNRNRSLTSVSMNEVSIDEFICSLPYSPTNAQLRSIKECICDMKKPVPMNRLLQGDVGSGKTLVAAAVCYFAAKNGCQSTLMAPTEILAKQHYNTLSSFLSPLGISVQLLTGALSVKEKNDVKKASENGTAQVIVGTQALIQSKVSFHKLGVVITDEQHRFGVAQRSELAKKGENPHTLVMSATPIPRTLALLIYGDLDISLLDEMPKGRLPIRTYAVDTSYRTRLYNFIRKYVSEGYQAYIVCPMIDENVNEKASAVKYYQELKNGCFSDIELGLLHGRMKQAEKDEVMTRFKNNEVKVLVSTTVIEVGVDVPNAVVMIIENAEQFGLSQLHQLRGRVGRGSVQSHCILVTDSNSKYTKERTDIMVKTSDGFEIANKDLDLRGPGDFFGTEQHGLPTLKIADMTEDVRTISAAQEAANQIISADSGLKLPENKGLKELVKSLFKEGEEFGFN